MNLSWLQIAFIGYLSLWVFKMFLVVGDFPYIARFRIEHGVAPVREGWTVDSYVRLMSFFYTLGAGMALALLLVPTLYKEGLSFFISYPKDQLEHFALNE